MVQYISQVYLFLSTTALEPQSRFLKIPQPKQEPQPRFSENSLPIHHYCIPSAPARPDPPGCPPLIATPLIYNDANILPLFYLAIQADNLLLKSEDIIGFLMRVLFS